MNTFLKQIRRRVNIILKQDPSHSVQKSVKYLKFGNDGADWAFIPNLNKDSIVYSFGIGEDISFDVELIKKYRLKVFAFDPTPRSLAWLKKQRIPKYFKAYPWGIGGRDGLISFIAPKNPRYVSFKMVSQKSSAKADKFQVYTLTSIMKKLKHKQIDLLKIDIEGSEYSVIANILKSKLKINQILVEFHHRFPEYSIHDTELAIQRLNKNGYQIFYISDLGQEYSLIK